MSAETTTIKLFGFELSQKKLNAVSGIIGIYAVGIFLTWYIAVILQPPMPEGVVERSAVNALIQTLCTIVIPYVWAIRRLGFTLGDLGLTTRRLAPSILLGCLLYSLALAAFIHCSADPLISNHAVGKLDLASAIGLAASMSLIAAGTDFATRGFVLFALARYANIPIAVFFQNLVWYLGHVHEINLLSNCLGLWTAVGLTLTLGVLGDVIALKTRNVVGLALAHILLNVVLTIYIRTL
jgi:hypothetical protein